MPIMHVLDTPLLMVVQHCAGCGNVNTIPISILKLGNGPDHNQVALPACSCGAQEFLYRTFDVVPEELAQHRKVVNALIEKLIDSDQIHDFAKTKVEAETRIPLQVGDLIGSVPAFEGMPDLIVPKGTKLP